jgi:hypothetical protein
MLPSRLEFDQEKFEQGVREALAREVFASPDPVFVALNKEAHQTLAKPRIVHRDVRRFGREFLEGTKDPIRYLRAARPRGITESGRLRIQSPVAHRWLSTPIEKRIFVIGAREDEPLVRRFRRELEMQGYTVFFYLDCSTPQDQLCTSETVGALFATSGQTLISRSAPAQASEYIPVELLVASGVRGGANELWFMVTPTEVSAAVRSSAATVQILVVEERTT